MLDEESSGIHFVLSVPSNTVILVKPFFLWFEGCKTICALSEMFLTIYLNCKLSISILWFSTALKISLIYRGISWKYLTISTPTCIQYELQEYKYFLNGSKHGKKIFQFFLIVISAVMYFDILRTVENVMLCYVWSSPG